MLRPAVADNGSKMAFVNRSNIDGEEAFFDSDIGIIGIYLVDNSLERVALLGRRNLPVNSGKEPSEAANEVKRQILEYLSGNRRSFELKFTLNATDFQRRVYEVVSKIAYGETVTYGEVARTLGLRCCRAVGQALKRNKLPLIVPCHRVVSKEGLGGYTYYYGNDSEIKRFLLDLERKNAFNKISTSF